MNNSMPRFSIEPLEDRTTPVTITVNTLADVVAVDGFISLREAIAAANTDTAVNEAPAGSGADIINFGVTGTISLSLGQIVITDDLTIDGPGSGSLTIDGLGLDQIFEINDANGLTTLNAVINDVTLANGASNQGAAIFNFENLLLQNSVLSGNVALFGGALANYTGATSLLDNCTFVYNQGYTGGAVDNYGSLTITGGSFTNNNSLYNGGALHNQAFGTVGITGAFFGSNYTTSNYGGAILNQGSMTIAGSTFSGNQVISGYGGAIANRGYIQITDSTISNNSANYGGGGVKGFTPGSTTIIRRTTISGNTTTGAGGGVYLYEGSLFMENCTVSGNSTLSSADGGGIHIELGSATIIHSTITLNSSFGPGGGIQNQFGSSGLVLEHSIVSGNTGVIAADLYSQPTPLAVNFNVIEKLSSYLPPGAMGNIIGQSALLGPLANNGGPTLTHMPIAGSPAIDAGDPAIAFPPVNDQRGSARILGAAIDIGSVEAGSPACTVTAVASGSDLIITGCPDDNVISISQSSGGFVVVFADSTLIGSFSSPARILVDAQAGNDFVSIDSSLTVPCSVVGGDGDDTLLSGAGTDTLIGGLGNDLYVFHDGFGLDTIIESVGEGFDTLDLSEVTTTLTYDLGGEGLPAEEPNGFSFESDAIERLILGSGDDFVALRGDASAPNLMVDGGPGTDTLDYEFSTLTGSVNLSAGAAPGLSSAINFETVVGLATAGPAFGSSSESVLAQSPDMSDAARRHTAGGQVDNDDNGWI